MKNLISLRLKFIESLCIGCYEISVFFSTKITYFRYLCHKILKIYKYLKYKNLLSFSRDKMGFSKCPSYMQVHIFKNNTL